MTTMTAGQTFPDMTVSRLGGGKLSLGQPQGGPDWQMIVVYRGLHCPICKTYLEKLQSLEGDFRAAGVEVIAISGDPEEKAKAMAEEKELSLPIGYDLSIPQMRELGLYVSDPRSPQETDRPFPEPGLFIVNGEGRVQIVDVSNAPFARPDLERLLSGIKFIRDKDYPIRGTHAA